MRYIIICFLLSGCMSWHTLDYDLGYDPNQTSTWNWLRPSDLSTLNKGSRETEPVEPKVAP